MSYTKSKDHDIIEIPLSEIFSDDDFNCRGPIIPFDVIELARDIEKNGLLQPIAVHNYNENGYKYRIVLGHRRFAAFRQLNRETIPAFIKEDIDNTTAMIMNLAENLKRKNLNILQEAKAIKKFFDQGMKSRRISKELDVSENWVNVRFALLQLPEDVQIEAAAGFLTQEQIKDLYGMPMESMYEAVRTIKDARLRGESRRIKIKGAKPRDPDTKKVRDRTEMFRMQDIIREALGNNLATRTLAWTSGIITDNELYDDIKEQVDIPWSPPNT